MQDVPRRDVRNRLLSLLSAADFARISPFFEAVDLSHGYRLAEAGKPIEYAYFLDHGIGSIVAVSPEGQRAEAGLFGRDGYSPPSLIFGSDVCLFDILIQVPGSGHRIALPALREALDTIPGMRSLMLLFVQTLSTQTAYTALSNAVHQIDERLARWLLMCHDRIDGDAIALTHEFMSLMLAVRRPSVTTALHVLEGNRMIRAERGYITIRDRKALEAFAADTYGKPEDEYRRLIGDIR